MVGPTAPAPREAELQCANRSPSYTLTDFDSRQVRVEKLEELGRNLAGTLHQNAADVTLNVTNWPLTHGVR